MLYFNIHKLWVICFKKTHNINQQQFRLGSQSNIKKHTPGPLAHEKLPSDLSQWWSFLSTSNNKWIIWECMRLPEELLHTGASKPRWQRCVEICYINRKGNLTEVVCPFLEKNNCLYFYRSTMMVCKSSLQE